MMGISAIQKEISFLKEYSLSALAENQQDPEAVSAELEALFKIYEFQRPEQWASFNDLPIDETPDKVQAAHGIWTLVSKVTEQTIPNASTYLSLLLDTITGIRPEQLKINSSKPTVCDNLVNLVETEGRTRTTYLLDCLKSGFQAIAVRMSDFGGIEQADYLQKASKLLKQSPIMQGETCALTLLDKLGDIEKTQLIGLVKHSATISGEDFIRQLYTSENLDQFVCGRVLAVRYNARDDNSLKRVALCIEYNVGLRMRVAWFGDTTINSKQAQRIQDYQQRLKSNLPADAPQLGYMLRLFKTSKNPMNITKPVQA